MTEWISVEERLPEAGRVIVYTPNHYGEEYIGIVFHNLGVFSHGDHYVSVYNVTHWMPLPDPPEALDE